MAVTTNRTRTATAEDHYPPIAPDGTWLGEWPPDVWLVTWRVQVLGYRKVLATVRSQITEAARALYIERYGQEPPRRGRRRHLYTVVFEHDRVGVIDDAARASLVHRKDGSNANASCDHLRHVWWTP